MECTKENCPMTIAVNLISGKWKLFIMYSLRNGPQRYGDLKRTCTNITEKMLTSQLKELEKDGLIKRKSYSEIPPKVEYSFTEIGEKLNKIFDPLYSWGVDYIKELKPEQFHLIENFQKENVG